MADLIIKNGSLFTGNPERTISPNGAVAVTGRRMVAVGLPAK